jgi:ABC-type cobalamin/Fe3+-siderophores transport system ATPase subunit
MLQSAWVSEKRAAGYVMGLIGANGAGKTTAIQFLLGMRGFEVGEIELPGCRVPGPVALRQHSHGAADAVLGAVCRQRRDPLPLFIRFGYTRVSVLSGTLPRALVVYAVIRLHPHLSIESFHRWLSLAWAADVAAIAASAAITADQRRLRYSRPQRDDRTIRDQYPM